MESAMNIANILRVLVLILIPTVHAQEMTAEWIAVQTASCKLWNGLSVPCIIFQSPNDAEHIRVAIRANFDGAEEVAVVKEYSSTTDIFQQQGRVIWVNPKIK